MKSCSSKRWHRRARDDSGPVDAGAEFPLDDPRTWESLAAGSPGFCLVAGFRPCFPRASLNIWWQTVRDGGHWWSRVKRDRSNLRPVAESGRRISGRSAGFISPISPCNRGHQVAAADLVVLPASILNPPSGAAARRRAASRKHRHADPHASLAGTGRHRRTGAGCGCRVPRGLWYREVWDQASAGHAERTLFRSLKGKTGGLSIGISNRTFSRLLTRLFSQLKCSPNTITMVATAVGSSPLSDSGWGPIYGRDRCSAVVSAGCDHRLLRR